MRMIKESKKIAIRLYEELEKVGLNYVSEKEGYRTDKWIFKCPWKKEDKIEILWHKTFTENTAIDYDDCAEFVVNDIVMGTVEISKLLHRKQEYSAYDIILEKFKLIASNYTGKGKKRLTTKN